MPLAKLHTSFNIRTWCLYRLMQVALKSCVAKYRHQSKMPALTGCKCQALQQWTGGSRAFGKHARHLFMDTNSDSDFGDTFISTSENSDASIEVWSDGVGPTEESEEEDPLNSLEMFFSVFHKPSHRGNVAKHTKEVNIG